MSTRPRSPTPGITPILPVAPKRRRRRHGEDYESYTRVGEPPVNSPEVEEFKPIPDEVASSSRSNRELGPVLCLFGGTEAAMKRRRQRIGKALSSLENKYSPENAPRDYSTVAAPSQQTSQETASSLSADSEEKCGPANAVEAADAAGPAAQPEDSSN
uniref:Uncharacterized protein n=1 Tax=Pinguiococcus pyrenoidosus TaxID=172671 RepID=A0A7R9UDS1_9STRA|mmetsp:Transcript_6949/g.26794  ORF Transcript_6949/g.26794 Transcript_6949/m.26794 type:complete len:158 (+) Transcript_6949:563-1036(+)